MALGEVDRREIRRGCGRDHLRLPDHRRYRHPADPAHRHLHLRARRLVGAASSRIVEKCLEVRGCKIKITKVPIPVAYGAGVRGRAHPQGADATSSSAATAPPPSSSSPRARLAEVEDGKIEVIGPDIDEVEAGHGAAAGHLGRGRRAQDAGRLRADPRAPDPPPDQRRRRHLAHGPARHHLDAHQQGRAAPRASPSRHSARSCTPSSSTTIPPSWTRCR